MSEIYTGLTVFGLYDDQTGNPLFGVVGTPAASGSPAVQEAVLIAGIDDLGLIRSLPIGTMGNQVPGGSPDQGDRFYGIYVAGISTNGDFTPLTFDANGMLQTSMPGIGTTAVGSPAVNALNVYLVGQPITVTVPGDVEVVQDTAADLNATVFQGTSPWVVSGSVAITGTVAVTQSTSPWIVNLEVNGVPLSTTTAGSPAETSLNVFLTGSNVSITASGNLSNNTAVPNGANTGVLPAIAESSPSNIGYTNGYQVLLVTDLHGNLNTDTQYWGGVVLGAPTAFGTAPSGNVIGTNSNLFAGGLPLGYTLSGSPATASLDVNITGGSVSVSGTVTVTVTGTVAVTQSTSPWIVAGNLTNNNAAPTSNNVGVLPAVVGSQSYTTGDQVLLTTDNTGALRVDVINNSNSSVYVVGTPVLAGSPPTTNVTLAGGTDPNGNAESFQTTTKGTQITIPADEAEASKISYFSYATVAAYKVFTAGTATALWSIQANSAAITYLFRELQWFTDGSVVKFQLVKNATLTGTSFTALPYGNVKVDLTGVYTPATGIPVVSGFVGQHPFHDEELLIAMSSGTPGDTYTMVANGFGVGTVKTAAAIRWSEVTGQL